MDNETTISPGGLRHTLIGLIFVGFAVIAWAMLADSKTSSNYVMAGDPGPFLLADIAIGVIAFAGVVMLATGIHRSATAAAGGEPSLPFAAKMRSPAARAWLLPIVFAASAIAMPTALLTLGTPLAIILFAAVWISILQRRAGEPMRRVVISAVLGSLATAAFIYVGFIQLLQLPLPL